MKMQVVKKISKDTAVDIIAGFLIGVGIYSFAAQADFPLAGVSGIALIFYRLFGLPIGMMQVALNIPIAIICYKTLGRDFFIRSIRTLVITSVIIDYVVVPFFPLYSGDRMLAALCTGLLGGLGYAIVFMNGSSTGGIDFVTLTIRHYKPHLSIGRIVLGMDVVVILIGSFLFRDIDGAIFGILITYMFTLIIDKLMYGLYAGKVTMIVTEQGQDIANLIEEQVQRGSTILKARGSYTGIERDVVLCACNSKEMYRVRKLIKKLDPQSFTVIMDSNEVYGEGFQEE